MSVKETLLENREEIVNGYNQGVSTCELGRRYGCSNASVWLFLQKEGVEVRKTQNKYDKEEVRKLFEAGRSAYSIEKELGVPKTTLSRMAKDLGFDISGARKKSKSEDSLKNQKKEIVQSYESGESSEKIAQRLGFHGSTVSRLLNDNDVDMRHNYEVDENFFNVIDTEEKAYILGFLYADGCVTQEGSMEIKLAEEDTEILEKISKCISYTGPIHHYPPSKKFPHRQWSCAISVRREKLRSDLEKLGCIPNKTFLTVFPKDHLPDHLIHHFIRGVFDGDGSLHSSGKNWTVSIAGTDTLLSPMLQFIRDKANVVGGLFQQGNIKVLKVGGNYQVGRVLDLLYKDATIYLDRKHALYKRFGVIFMETH